MVANAISLPVPAMHEAQKPYCVALFIESKLFGPGAMLSAKQAGMNMRSVEMFMGCTLFL
jgi:hypothetical protein